MISRQASVVEDTHEIIYDNMDHMNNNKNQNLRSMFQPAASTAEIRPDLTISISNSTYGTNGEGVTDSGRLMIPIIMDDEINLNDNTQQKTLCCCCCHPNNLPFRIICTKYVMMISIEVLFGALVLSGVLYWLKIYLS